MDRLNVLENGINGSGSPPTTANEKEINLLKRHLSKIEKEKFDTSCEHNSLQPLECLEGMPFFDPSSFPSILMRPNTNPNPTPNSNPRTVIAIDEGLNPEATGVDLGGNVFVAGYSLSNYIRNANRKSDKLQSRIDTRGNLLAQIDYDKLAHILRTSMDDKVRNKARSDYDAARAKLINNDALCKSWKRQKENIKKNKEQACSVVREEFATFAALFDIVIIGKNDLKQWHKNLSHASSSVLSALSLGELHKKIKFKVSLTVPLIVAGSGGWSVCGSE
jgi:hypothetical protein